MAPLNIVPRCQLFVVCSAQAPVNFEHEHEGDQEPIILRKRRASPEDKNTCQLFIQTDHLFFNYYGSREAVIAQV